jgi:hypothetical protein
LQGLFVFVGGDYPWQIIARQHETEKIIGQNANHPLTLYSLRYTIKAEKTRRKETPWRSTA